MPASIDLLTRKGLRVWSAIVVAVLLLAPPFIRAMQPLSDADTSSVIRLNRGFDAPESKVKIAPSTRPVVEPTVTDLTPVPPAAVTVPTRDDVIPDSLHDTSPEPLRGPPSPAVA